MLANGFRFSFCLLIRISTCDVEQPQHKLYLRCLLLLKMRQRVKLKSKLRVKLKMKERVKLRVKQRVTLKLKVKQ